MDSEKPKNISVLKELKSFEAKLEKQIGDAEKRAERKIADSKTNADKMIANAREEIGRNEKTGIEKARKLGMEEGKHIIAEYHKKTEKLKRTHSSNFDGAVKAVIGEITGKGA